MARERRLVAFQRLRHVSQADGLQRHRRHALPAGRLVHPRAEPLRVREVAPEARLQARDAGVEQVEPQLERAETAAERDVPVAEVADRAVRFRPQVARVRAHHADQMLRVAHVICAVVEAHAHPLVRVEDQAVGALDAVPERAALGQHHRRPGERRVDVQPQAVLARELGDPGERVDCRRPRRADRGDDRARHAACRAIGGDRVLQPLEAQRVAVVGLDEAQVVPAEAREQRRLLDRAVAFARGVDDERRLEPLEPRAVLAEARAALARAQERAQRGRARRIVDDAGPRLGEPDHLPQPVHHDLFELGRGRARLPAHALDAESRGGEVGQDRRVAGVAREVGEERRVVPVRDARQHVGVEPRDGVFEPAAFARGLFRKAAADLAGAHGAHHRQPLHALAVVRHPVDELVAQPAKGRPVHVASGR